MLQQWKQETNWSLHDPILLTDKGCNFSSKMSNDLSESLRRWKTSVNTLNSRISSGWRNKQAPTCSWYGNKWLTWHWKDSTGEANKWGFHATKYLHIKKKGHLHVDGLLHCWGKGFYQWIEFRVPHHLMVFLRFGWLTVLSSIKIVEQELYFRDSRPGETFRQRNHTKVRLQDDCSALKTLPELAEQRFKAIRLHLK